MPRIACLLATLAALAVPLAPASFAATPHQGRAHAARPQPRPAPVAVAARPVIVGYTATYAPHASRPLSPVVQSRGASPLSYLPAVSPDAPQFSFSPQDPPGGWNWQRASLQQVDAELRARRAQRQREEGPGPANR